MQKALSIYRHGGISWSNHWFKKGMVAVVPYSDTWGMSIGS